MQNKPTKTFIDFYLTFNVILSNVQCYFTKTLLLRDIYCILTSASIHLYHVRLSCVNKGFTYLLTYSQSSISCLPAATQSILAAIQIAVNALQRIDISNQYIL